VDRLAGAVWGEISTGGKHESIPGMYQSTSKTMQAGRPMELNRNSGKNVICRIRGGDKSGREKLRVQNAMSQE